MPSDPQNPSLEGEKNTEQIPATINEEVPGKDVLLEMASREPVPVYRLVPERLIRQGGLPDETVCWQIELHNLDANAKPMGLDVIGDTIIGRGSSSDVNLDEYSVFFSGVSRKHIALRPTKEELYIIDLGSTNGTMVNNVPIPRNQPRPLASGDTITIGKFSILLLIRKKFTWKPSIRKTTPAPTAASPPKHVQPEQQDDPTQPTINLSLGSEDDES